MQSGGPFIYDSGPSLAAGLGSNVGAAAGLAGAGEAAGAGGLGAGLAGALGAAPAAAVGGAGGGFLSGAFPGGIGSWFGGVGGGLKAGGFKAAAPMGLLGLGLGTAGSLINAHNRDHPGFDMGDVGQFLQGGGLGLGVAGPLALALGASGPVGWGIGGAALLGGGIANALWGHGSKADDTKSKLDKANEAFHTTLAKLAAIDPSTAHTIHQQLSAMYPFATEDKDKIALLQRAAGTISANFGISQQRSGAYDNASQLLDAVQSYQGSHYADQASKYNADEAQRAAYMNQLAGHLRPEQQAYAHYMVGQQLEQAAQTLQQNQQQVTALPYILAMQMQQQIGQQYAPYGITPAAPTAGASASPTSPSGIDLASLLQGAGASN